MVFVFALVYNTIGKGYLMKVEAPWVKMALYCDDIYIIPGQVAVQFHARLSTYDVSMVYIV